jgi:Tfp pilus assembly protein PilO
MVESALPDESDLPNLFILTHNLISSSSLIGEDIEIKEEDGGFGISVALHGSYGSFKQFLLEAEKSLRIFDVESIVFSSVGAKSSGTDILTFKVSMKTWLH